MSNNCANNLGNIRPVSRPVFVIDKESIARKHRVIFVAEVTGKKEINNLHLSFGEPRKAFAEPWVFRDSNYAFMVFHKKKLTTKEIKRSKANASGGL
jgi:hypothetical protein